ncbi:MAG TPA: hypothetical protein PKJ26_05535 [Candidatus Woesebacteria bacterium]|nr:hypothetical protein [Candidatus Woesebacteria bacterium]HNS65926.1 hypothetical protein [Candidatus Woesebacteria bacterium]
MPTMHFTPLWRPQKVSWVYPTTSDKSVLENIRSKNARKFVSTIPEFLQRNKFELSSGACTFKEYREFLELYNERTAARGFDPIAKVEWFSAKKREGKKVEKIFIRHNDQLIGGKIITVIGDEVRSSYKASQQLPIFQKLHNASLGLILDYSMLDHYTKKKPSLLTAGTSRNLFGVFNTIGYLTFKLRMGYQPQVINPKTIFEQTTKDPHKDIWLAFLCDSATIKQPLTLYYSGELDQIPQLAELQKLISLEKLTDAVQYKS